jgi:hypothetical protein
MPEVAGTQDKLRLRDGQHGLVIARICGVVELQHVRESLTAAARRRRMEQELRAIAGVDIRLRSSSLRA